MKITPVKDATEFTTEMLGHNFINIGQQLGEIEEWMYLFEHRLAELVRQAELARGKKKLPKGKLLVVGLVGYGLYKGYQNRKHLAKKLEALQAQLQDLTVEKVADKVEEVVYGESKKQPANVTLKKNQTPNA